MKQRKQKGESPPPGPFDAVLSVFGRRAKVETPDLAVEKRNADVGMLDEVASLDIAVARRQFERLETAYASGAQPASADVSLYTSAVASVRASVAEKARLLGTYGAVAGKQDKDATPTFRIVVNREGGRLPPETGAEDDGAGEDLAVVEPKESNA